MTSTSWSKVARSDLRLHALVVSNTATAHEGRLRGSQLPLLDGIVLGLLSRVLAGPLPRRDIVREAEPQWPLMIGRAGPARVDQ
jgi:hypothetical protein